MDDDRIAGELAQELQAGAARMQAAAASGAESRASSGSAGLMLVETAGGVTSPGPSGTLAVSLRKSLWPEGPSGRQHVLPHACIACLGLWMGPQSIDPALAGCERSATRRAARVYTYAHTCVRACTQCDLLRPLRLPCVLVGDARLGGISATLSAYESLVLRGYDVDALLLMDSALRMEGA